VVYPRHAQLKKPHRPSGWAVEPKEIPVDKDRSPEHISHRCQGQERTVGNHGATTALVPGHEKQANHGSYQGTGKEGEDHPRYPHEGADHRQQLDVAAPDSFPLPEDLVADSDGEQNAATRRKAREGFDDPHAGQNERSRQPDNHARQGNKIRNGEGIQVDEDDHKESAKKDEVDGGLEAWAEVANDGHAEESGQHLYQEVSRRDRPLAVSTPTPEDQVAQEGNVVEETNGRLAMGAVRSGPDQRLPLREPKDTDVEKAADRRSQQEKPEKKHAVHTRFTFSPGHPWAPILSGMEITPCRLVADPADTRRT
jgi:hypothetical protein